MSERDNEAKTPPKVKIGLPSESPYSDRAEMNAVEVEKLLFEKYRAKKPKA